MEDQLLKLRQSRSLPHFDIKTCVTKAMKQTPAHFPVDPSEFPRGMPITTLDLFRLHEALIPNVVYLEHLLTEERVVLGRLHLRSKAKAKTSYSRTKEWESTWNRHLTNMLRMRQYNCGIDPSNVSVLVVGIFRTPPFA